MGPIFSSDLRSRAKKEGGLKAKLISVSYA